MNISYLPYTVYGLTSNLGIFYQDSLAVLDNALNLVERTRAALTSDELATLAEDMEEGTLLATILEGVTEFIKQAAEGDLTKIAFRRACMNWGNEIQSHDPTFTVENFLSTLEKHIDVEFEKLQESLHRQSALDYPKKAA